MKAIFLDIDGVLNCDTTLENAPSNGKGVDNELIQNLAFLINELNFDEVVLTSTWRMELFPRVKKDGEYLINKFQEAGIMFDFIKDRISAFRGFEVNKFLTNSEDIEDFIILDDEEFDFNKFENFKNRFFLIDGRVGLNKTKVNEIINALK